MVSTLGNLKLKNPYFLAPMEKINDIAFRILCKKAGASLCYTGMVNPLTKENLMLDDKPALQLFSNNEKGIISFIKKYENKVSLFDFNLGCAAEIAKKCKIGAFMHNNLKKIEKIISVMKSTTKKPITIKLRKSSYTEKIIKIAEKYCDAIAIHPRTKEQFFNDDPDIDFAKKIKEKFNLPIIYSGNVNEKNADFLLEKFDFIMIGRSAIGNPNIFAKLTNKKIRFNFNDYLKLALKYNLKFSQIKFQAINFTKNKKNASKIRSLITKIKTLNELNKIMNAACGN
ncbi:MAG: tRNA-dihydrouridine synthase family protein [Candidatus Pacearchaeota archaeon]